MTWFDEIDKARSKVEPQAMKWFELEGETANGSTFRILRQAHSMIAALQGINRGWTVLAAYEIDAAMEKARKVIAAALADNMFKAEMSETATKVITVAPLTPEQEALVEKWVRE